ncbi:hypothetical protein VTL71DRAFT_1683 [Oculimacula yallundae]|uniref:Uncharacterized protein n=1 Tax=Oculimacula yallundae TaxID=86028 RepID=A0ABR4CBH9_9HELO
MVVHYKSLHIWQAALILDQVALIPTRSWLPKDGPLQARGITLHSFFIKKLLRCQINKRKKNRPPSNITNLANMISQHDLMIILAN